MEPARRAQALRALDADRHLDDPATKQRYVTAVFDLVAPRYDAFTRRFSFGMDARWKREVLKLALAASEERGRSAIVADLAAGTGDIAFALAGEGRFVIAIDASREMLARAAMRAQQWNGGGPRFSAGDMVALPLPDASVDVVTVGYGLRNASRLDGTLDEIARVLRPGGHVVALDFYKPRSALWRTAFLGYLAVTGSVYGWLLHREPAAYGYIPRSISRFVTASELSAELARRGFLVYHERRRLLGGIAIHAAILRSAVAAARAAARTAGLDRGMAGSE